MGTALRVHHLDRPSQGGARRPDQAQQHGQQRRLAAPRRPDQRGHPARADLQARPGDPDAVAELHAQVADADRRAGGVDPLRPGPVGVGLEHVEHALGRPDPLGGRVEVHPHEAQRQVDLRGQHEHGQAGGQVHRPLDQAQADGDGDDRHGQRGQQLEDQRGQERDAQHAHRGRPVVLAHPPDGLGLGTGPVEHLQGGQALDHVEEVPREHAEGVPLPGDPGLRVAADEHHEHRDQRHGQGHDHGRQRVLGEDRHAPDERHDHGQDQLGQVAREVRVQGGRTPRDQRGQLAHPAAAQVRGPPSQRRLEHLQAQLRDRGSRRPVPHRLSRPGQPGAAHRDPDECQQRGLQVGHVGPVLEDRRDRPGDQERLGDDQQRRGRADRHRRDQEPPRGARMLQQAGVEGPHGRRFSPIRAPTTHTPARGRSGGRWPRGPPAGKVVNDAPTTPPRPLQTRTQPWT